MLNSLGPLLKLLNTIISLIKKLCRSAKTKERESLIETIKNSDNDADVVDALDRLSK